MLDHLDNALEAFLRAAVPLPAHDYAVSFEAPDKQWSATRSSRTTVNIYLRDVGRNSTLRETGLERVESGGELVFRPPLPLVDCRYLITVWSVDVGDEHSTLGAVLAAILLHPTLPEEHLSAATAHLRPLPRVQLRTVEAEDNSDFWNALGGQLKPGLDIVVTAPVDAAPMRPVGPPVEEYLLRTRDVDGEHAGERVVQGDRDPAALVQDSQAGGD